MMHEEFCSGVDEEISFSTYSEVSHPIQAATALRELFGHAHTLVSAPILEQWLPLWYGKGIKWLEWLSWERAGEKEIRGIRHVRMVHREGDAE